MITEAQIKKHLGDLPLRIRHFPARKSWQVNLESPGELTHYEIAKMLVEIQDRLEAEGLNASVQLSHMDQRTNTWRPWPCVWVNQVPRAEEKVRNVDERLTKLIDVNERLVARLAASGQDVGEEMRLLAQLATSSPGAPDRDFTPPMDEEEDPSF